MKKDLFKNIDFVTKTTYTELQLLYACGKISINTFAEKVIYFWNKNNTAEEELVQDYDKYKYCFNIFMDEVINIEGDKRTELVCLHKARKVFGGN